MAMRPTLLVAVLLLGTAMPGLAADPRYDLERALAADLLAVMKIEDRSTQKVERRILEGCRKEKCDADMRQCLMKIEPDYFDMFVGSGLRQALTTDEMKVAIAYFKTEAGHKHLDILRAEQGLGGTDTVFNQASEIRARILSFLDTRAGYLLITRSVLSDGINRWVSTQILLAEDRCKPGQRVSSAARAARSRNSP